MPAGVPGPLPPGVAGLDRRRTGRMLGGVRPLDLQVIGSELAIKWADGSEDYLTLEALRRACPCAACQGEVDVMGHLHRGPPPKLTPNSYQLVRLAPVGAYGLQPVWGDGHNTGLFTFDNLRRLARARDASASGQDVSQA